MLVMKIGFVGCGKMAGALVQGVLKAGAFTKDAIIGADRYPAAAKILADQCGVSIAADNRELAASANVLVLCVKPGQAHDALTEIRDGAKDKHVI